MDLFFDQLIELLKSPAGSMGYHLIISFAILGAFTIFYPKYIKNKSIYNLRITIWIGVLLILRISLFFIIGLMDLNIIENPGLLPEISRGFDILNLFTLLALWLFSFPKTKIISYTYFVWMIIISLGILIIFIWITFSPPISIVRNAFLPYTNLFIITFLYIGIVLIYSWKPKNWFLGLIMFFLMIWGELGQTILYSNQTDFPFFVRFLQLVSIPLLFGINLDNQDTLPKFKIPDTEKLDIQLIEVKGKAIKYQNENKLLLQEIITIKDNFSNSPTNDLEKYSKIIESLTIENNLIKDKLSTELIDKKINSPKHILFFPKSINLSHILDEVLNSMSKEFHKRELSLRVDLTEDLPDITSDKKAIIEIISKLLVEASNSCSPNSEIFISTKFEKVLFERKFIILGIFVKIKKPLTMLNSQLPVISQNKTEKVDFLKSKKIIEALGGELDIKDKPGKGLEYLLKLPISFNEDQNSENF